MEGAILGGKLAAEVVADRAMGKPTKGLKVVQPIPNPNPPTLTPTPTLQP